MAALRLETIDSQRPCLVVHDLDDTFCRLVLEETEEGRGHGKELDRRLNDALHRERHGGNGGIGPVNDRLAVGGALHVRGVPSDFDCGGLAGRDVWLESRGHAGSRHIDAQHAQWSGAWIGHAKLVVDALSLAHFPEIVLLGDGLRGVLCVRSRAPAQCQDDHGRGEGGSARR